MGLFDYFRRRRQRESAVADLSVTADPSQQVQPMTAGGNVEAQAGAAGQPQQVGGLDLAQIAQIGTMIAQAAQSGNIQIQQGDAQTIDLRGSGLREEILGIMEQHGIDPDPGSGQRIDASQMPGMQEQILDALSQAGVDPGAMGSDAYFQIDSSGGGLDSSAGDFGGGGDSGGGDSGGGDSGGGGGTD